MSAMSGRQGGGPAHGDLRELYQEVIFDHNRKPRNFHVMAQADHVAHGHNPLCGDQLTVYLRVVDDVVADVSFEGHGCAISKASASLMTEAVKGRSVADVEALFQDFHALLTDVPSADRDFGKLQVLAGVRDFPARVKCATLAWHTLHNALIGAGETARTE
jgi:nitrogen fixation NifU-like protein